MAVVDTGLYNVQGTLFSWLFERLTANKPPLLDSVSMSVEWPEEPITAPMFSAIVLNADEGDGYQGSHVGNGQHGNMRFGIAQIDCWITRRDNDWAAKLAQMQDAVVRSVNQLRATGSVLVIKDFYTNPGEPADTTAKIMIDRVERRQAPDDPNPDIRRKIVLLFFQWVERV